MKSSEIKEYDLVILFSGGADSVLMLEFAKAAGLKPFCVLINYQQLHKEELTQALAYLDKEEIDCRVVKLWNLGVNSGLTGDGIKGRFQGVHEMHVPSRNLMFVGIAASIAESMFD